MELAGHTLNTELFHWIISKHSYMETVMNGVVTSRVSCCGSGLGDLEWNFRALVSSSEKVYPGVLPGHGAVRALLTQIGTVVLKSISHLFSLHFDACDREVLGFVNLVPFGQKVYSRSVPNAFQLANGLQCKR